MQRISQSNEPQIAIPGSLHALKGCDLSCIIPFAYPKGDSSVLDQRQIQSLRERLELSRRSLLEDDETAREAAKPVVLDQSTVGRLSRMDAMQGQAMALESQRRKQLQLQRTVAALRRIESDEFGVCEDCDQEIDPRRLDPDPTGTLCIGCAASREP